MAEVALSRGDVLVLSWAGPAGSEDMVAAALGVEDASEVEVFAASAIAPIGMTAYLAEGHGIAAADLEAEAARLDGLTGTIVVVSARAFEAGRGSVEIARPLSLVARFREAKDAPTAPRPIETESAKGNLSGAPAKAPKSDARIGGMVAMAVLVFLAVFVYLFIGWAG